MIILLQMIGQETTKLWDYLPTNPYDWQWRTCSDDHIALAQKPNRSITCISLSTLLSVLSKPACPGCTPANVSGPYWHVPCPAPYPYMSPTEARPILPISTPDGFAPVSPLQSLITSLFHPGAETTPFCPNQPRTVHPYVALHRSVPDPYINFIETLPGR